MKANKHQTILDKIIKKTSSLPRLLTVLVISLLVVGGAYGYKYGYRYYDDQYSKTEPVAKVKSGVKSGGTANFTIASGTPTTQSTTVSSPTQATTPPTTSTPQQSSSSSTVDPQTEALQNQINFITGCDNDMSTAYDAYYAVVTSAENTYNTDLATEDQQAESYYPAGSDTLSEVENNILNGEITKYNATIAPAYATYLSAMNTINSRGCNLTPDSEYLY
jgi:hypothetical protein